MQTETVQLKATSLRSIHLQAGARMVDFGGWEMPVQYSSIVEEHHAVRRAAGLFDVSHMGEIEVRGPQALDLVNFVSTNDASKLTLGQAHYSGLLYEHGGFVDDILVHKVADNHYFICVNASNQDKDFEHIRAQNRFDCEVENAGPLYSQLAIQGPQALTVLQGLTGVDLAQIGYYHFVDGLIGKVPARIARTGYTGEDGFEIYLSNEEAPSLWHSLLEAGQPAGIRPCGLGARNTLRLEAKMALYGHEIDASISPLEAGLAWIVKFDKGAFLGRDALVKQTQQGVRRKLMGFEMTGRGIGRDGYEVFVDDTAAGWVTSGCPSPTLGRNIGLCYLPTALALPGRVIHVIVRGQPVEAKLVPTPFYQRNK